MMDGSSVAKSGTASRDALSGLLVCLDADAGKAWIQYDLIRRRLVKFFECSCCWPAEEYADEVLDRIAKRPDIRQIRDIASFAVGVARNLRLEDHKRTQRIEYLDGSPAGADALADPHDFQRDIVEQIDEEVRLRCLKKCLAEMPAAERDLVLAYYSAEGLKHHEHRKALAQRQGLKMDALRVRMNRSREKLERCVAQCLAARRSKLSAADNSASQQ
jgi:DNA-directed RNA polymerase specialized sigma24 family protein